MINNTDCIIVAKGDFPASHKTLEILKNKRFTICCDGALSAMLGHGFIPDAIVGDLDSISPELLKAYKDITHLDSDQETNDLTKSVNYAYSKGFRNITILGATGKREDHTLGNISLLCQYRHLFESVTMITDYGYFVSVGESSSFSTFPGQQISIFSLDNEVRLTIAGLKYPLRDRSLHQWWEATLNEALSDNFAITTNKKTDLIIFFADNNNESPQF